MAVPSPTRRPRPTRGELKTSECEVRGRHEGALDWGSGTAEGKFGDKFERRVSRMIKRKRITRNGNSDNPAQLTVYEDGDRVLKGCELEKT